MNLTRIELRNWKNFREADIPLQQRVFIIGPNASGKSNILDAIRFLRDIAADGGGLQSAVHDRRSVTELRCLSARQYSKIAINTEIDDDNGGVWGYELEFSQNKRKQAEVTKEIVLKNGKIILKRPNENDENDKDLLSQTHLQQVGVNREFRQVADFFKSIKYRHIVPQLIRDPERTIGRNNDPFGGDFLEQLAEFQNQNKKAFDSRLKRITDAIRTAVPQFLEIQLQRDVKGRPHLKARYKHWRPGGAWQSETQFSDGTLRLLGFLWSLLDGTGPLLLEEPEISLHEGIVRYIPQMISSITGKSGRQIILSTHSKEMLYDEGISLDEVLLLQPGSDGTIVTPCSRKKDISLLVKGGLSIGEAVIPLTSPINPGKQMELFAMVNG